MDHDDTKSAEDDNVLDVLTSMYYTVRELAYSVGHEPKVHAFIEEPMTNDEATKQMLRAAILDIIYMAVKFVLTRK